MKKILKMVVSFCLVFALILPILPKDVFAATSYGIWVSGIEVTSDNKNDVLGSLDGSAATVRYDGTYLILDNANITNSFKYYEEDGVSYYSGVYSVVPLKLKLIGASKTHLNSTHPSVVFEGVSANICYIYGEGTLEINVFGEGCIGMYIGNHLDFYGNAEVIINATGTASSGICMVPQYNSSVVNGYYNNAFLDVNVKGNGSVGICNYNGGIEFKTGRCTIDVEGDNAFGCYCLEGSVTGAHVTPVEVTVKGNNSHGVLSRTNNMIFQNSYKFNITTVGGNNVGMRIFGSEFHEYDLEEVNISVTDPQDVGEYSYGIVLGSGGVKGNIRFTGAPFNIYAQGKTAIGIIGGGTVEISDEGLKIQTVGTEVAHAGMIMGTISKNDNVYDANGATIVASEQDGETFSVFACDTGEHFASEVEFKKHTHTWSEEYCYDETHHWRECLSEGCYITENSEKDGYSLHSFNSNNYCSTCGYRAAPSAPTLETKTATSVTLNELEGAEYSIDGETWQNSPTFEGLQRGTEYTFYQRYKEDGEISASEKSEGFSVTTNEEMLGDLDGDSEITTEDAVIIIKFIAGYEVEISKKDADINADGVVDIGDAVLILQYVAGYETEYLN